MTQFWGQFAILYGAALIGAAALMPYAWRMVRTSGRPLRLPPPVILLLSFAQTAILFVLVVAGGLIAAQAVGLGAPMVERIVAGRPIAEASLGLPPAAAFGGLAGLFLTGADLVLLPRMPAKLLVMARESTLWENFTASFYGGLNEELLTRLLGMSGVAWLLARLWHTASGTPTDAVFWSANIVMALLFAAGHLPATHNLAGRLTPLVIFRALALNMPIAILCGWLFCRFGIEAAIAAHFSADIVYHVGGTALLKANDRHRFIPGFPPAPSP